MTDATTEQWATFIESLVKPAVAGALTGLRDEVVEWINQDRELMNQLRGMVEEMVTRPLGEHEHEALAARLANVETVMVGLLARMEREGRGGTGGDGGEGASGERGEGAGQPDRTEYVAKVGFDQPPT